MVEPCYKRIENYFFDANSQPLGEGAFATVYKATDQKTDTTVAVKVICAKKLSHSKEQSNLFMREINVLHELKGEHIVRLLDVKRTPNNFYIFTDYCDGGDLESKLKAKYEFTEQEACSIIYQIADAFVTIQGLPIMNSLGQKVTVMHRDIKAANILFHQGKVKVADFGFAKFVEDTSPSQKNTLLGTPLYMSPQILNQEGYGVKCDIWSTGILFYQLLFGVLPWNGYSIPNLYKNIRTKPLAFPKDVSEETKDLLIKMLKIKEEDRISWKEVFEHPALKQDSKKVKVMTRGTSKFEDSPKVELVHRDLQAEA